MKKFITFVNKTQYMKKKNKDQRKLVDIFRNQANQKNQFDCAKILEELNQASLEGEYTKTVQLKINQARFIKTLGLIVKTDGEKPGYFEISWKNEEDC